MPLDPNQISAAIQSFGSPQIQGPQFRFLASAIALSTSTWANSSVLVAGIATGASGTGVCSGGILIPSDPSGFRARTPTISGVLGIALADAICLGVSTSVSATCRYLGSSPVVGSGVDVSRVVLADPGALFAVMSAGFNAFSFRGVQSQILAQELSLAIAGLFIAGTGVGGIVVGAGIGPPTAGTTASRLV